MTPLPRDRTAGARPSRPGHNGHGNDQIAVIQRARMVAAMIDVVAERGAAGATVARVVTRASVSRRTFYEIFDGGEDCLLAALEESIQAASVPVLQAYRQGGSWQEQIRAALEALLQFLDHEPEVAQLVVVQSLAAGPRVLACRARALTPLIDAVHAGRAHVKGEGPTPTPVTAEGVVGGALSILHARLLAPEREPLTALTPALMSMIVLPYLGPAAARRELDRPAPDPAPPRDPARRVELERLRHVPIRVTQRTVAVLSAIAARPGASNRQIGTAAEVVDQGQISKLLHRLAERGLIENTAANLPKGTANAWTLTPEGATIERAVNPTRAHPRQPSPTRDAS